MSWPTPANGPAPTSAAEEQLQEPSPTTGELLRTALSELRQDTASNRLMKQSLYAAIASDPELVEIFHEETQTHTPGNPAEDQFGKPAPTPALVAALLDAFVVPCPNCNPDTGRCSHCRAEAWGYYRAAINAIDPQRFADAVTNNKTDIGGYSGRDLPTLATHIKRHLLQHPENFGHTAPTRDEIAATLQAGETSDALDRESALRHADAVVTLLAGQPTIPQVKAQAVEEAAAAYPTLQRDMVNRASVRKWLEDRAQNIREKQ